MGFDSGLRFPFFLIETLPITSPKFSRCLKNGSDCLQKGQRAAMLLSQVRSFPL